MNISVNSSGGASIPPSTPEKNSRLNNNNIQGDTDPLMNSISPYVNQDYYIIKVSIESGAHEIQGTYVYILSIYFSVNLINVLLIFTTLIIKVECLKIQLHTKKIIKIITLYLYKLL